MHCSRPRGGSLALLAITGCGWLTSDAAALVEPTAPLVQHLAPAPSDATSGTRGSFGGSLVARPEWNVGPWGYAPPLPVDAAALLFAGASAAITRRDALDGELLACQLDVRFEEIKFWSSRPERWAAADLLVVFGAGSEGSTSAARVMVSGRNQRNRMYFAVPAARLALGDVVDVLVNDRDRVRARDFIDRVALRFDGQTPLQVATPVTTIECRVVEGAALRSYVHERLWDVDDALAQWRLEQPDIRSGTATCVPPPSIDASFTMLAATLGWDDSRVQMRLEHATAVETATLATCDARFAAFVAGLPAPGTATTLGDAGIAVRVSEMRCDEQTRARIESSFGRLGAESCAIGLELTRRGREALTLDAWVAAHPAWTVHVLDARGHALAVTPTGGAITVQPRATVLRELVTGGASIPRRMVPAGTQATAPPVLLELRESGGAERRVRLRLAQSQAPA